MQNITRVLGVMPIKRSYKKEKKFVKSKLKIISSSLSTARKH